MSEPVRKPPTCSGVMSFTMHTSRLRFACLALVLASCGVDRIQHADLPDGGTSMVSDGGATDAGAMFDAGLLDAGQVDAGLVDAGTNLIDAGATAVDAGADAGSTTDAGSVFDAGVIDAGMQPDAGIPCTPSGISPQLAAVSGGPYQNCQGGVIPRTDIQLNSEAFSGCCNELVRVCQVTGFSTQNALYCR